MNLIIITTFLTCLYLVSTGMFRIQNDRRPILEVLVGVGLLITSPFILAMFIKGATELN